MHNPARHIIQIVTGVEGIIRNCFPEIREIMLKAISRSYLGYSLWAWRILTSLWVTVIGEGQLDDPTTPGWPLWRTTYLCTTSALRMLSKWPWISRCGDYWQQVELRTDGACRIMMMMMWVTRTFIDKITAEIMPARIVSCTLHAFCKWPLSGTGT